jgi:aminoglycoside 6'-N-acetyltransferase I
VEVGLRSHADGCDTARPCGFLEGWYVEPEYRKRGIGGALIRRAEEWCRDQGCTELASDTWIDEAISQRAHAALGFEVVDRCVHFRKGLGS